MSTSNGPIGRKILHLEVTNVISSGGMGDIFVCRDSSGESLVLKRLREEIKPDKEVLARRRFGREVFTHAALSPSPHLVNSRYLVKDEGTDYLALEYVEGATLRAVLAQGPLPVHLAAEVALQVAYGLHAAWYASRLVHLDLKPENVLRLADGTVKLGDFGLARTAGRTVDGIGTRGYMPPEQMEPSPAMPQMDSYALGVLCYEMLCGQRPFARVKPLAEQRKLQETAHVTPPRTLRSDVPQPFNDFVMACLEVDPVRRPKHADELERLVSDIYTGTGGAISSDCPFDLWRAQASRLNVSKAEYNELSRAMRTSRFRRERKYTKSAGQDFVDSPAPSPTASEQHTLNNIARSPRAHMAYRPERVPVKVCAYAGVLLFTRNRFEEAEPYFLHMWRLDNEDTFSLSMAAQCCWKRGDNRGAERYFAQLLQVNPSNGRIWYYRSLMLAKDAGGETSSDETLKCLDEALRCDYTFVQAWNDRGTVLSQAGRPDEALASLGHAMLIAPSDGRLRANFRLATRQFVAAMPDEGIMEVPTKRVSIGEAGKAAWDYWETQPSERTFVPCEECGRAIDRDQGCRVAVPVLLRRRLADGSLVVEEVERHDWMLCEECFMKGGHAHSVLFASPAAFDRYREAYRHLEEKNCNPPQAADGDGGEA